MKLADLESIQKRLDKKNKKNSSENEINILESALNCINSDKNIEEELNNNYSKKDLCNEFDWDTNKPIVVIFSSDLTDGVFKFNWKIFRDNLTGLKETLNIIKEIKHINWLVKPHPSDTMNNVVTSTEAEN